MSRSRLFLARYDGECTNCFAEIYEGDDIAFVDDQIVCEECWEDAR